LSHAGAFAAHEHETGPFHDTMISG
jgi:hypothetical protein